MRTRENAAYAVVGGLLALALTIFGLFLMEGLGGFAGSLTFSTFGALWVLFGLAIALDCFHGALRRR